MRLVIAVLVALAAATRPAAACGVPDFGMLLADLSKGLASKYTPVHTPLLVIGSGAATDGHVVSLAVGYGWGQRDDSWLFPGTTLKRVLLGIRSDAGMETTALSSTFGWYTNTFGSLGFDVGAEAQMSGRRGLGPTSRLTLGAKGVALRLTGGALFGDGAPRVTGAAELVVEVMDLGGTL